MTSDHNVDMPRAPLCHVVFGLESTGGHTCRVFISQNGAVPSSRDFRVLNTLESIRYDPFCDDFGPMNFLSIVAFIEALNDEIDAASDLSLDLVFSVASGPRALTNAAFLMGAYLLLKLKRDPAEAQRCFKGLDKSLLQPYRDATYAPSDFDLHLIDCWGGLKHGQDLRWLAAPSGVGTEWGMIEPAEYAHYDDPFNGDLHEVVPGKLVAFRGPRDLGGREYFDDSTRGCRDFSPSYYVGIFKALGVSTVIRLNRPKYDPRDFTEHGIEHFDLVFEDCTAPPSKVVGRFLQIVESASGAVAVHCKAGLGRTGTLIALYMMKHHGFTARNAMGWLRIVRPGSVIGEQQRYLCDMERLINKAAAAPRQPAVQPIIGPLSPVASVMFSAKPPARADKTLTERAAAARRSSWSSSIVERRPARGGDAPPLAPVAGSPAMATFGGCSAADNICRNERSDPAVLAKQVSQGMLLRAFSRSLRAGCVDASAIPDVGGGCGSAASLQQSPALSRAAVAERREAPTVLPQSQERLPALRRTLSQRIK
jgi:cell division cycle 14